MIFSEALLAARKDIFTYCRLLNWTPSNQQRDLLRIVQEESTLPFDKRKKRIAVKSGQGPGKTAATTVVTSWRVIRDTDNLAIVTAPTQRQVKDVWMAELRRLFMNADPHLQRLIDIDNFKMTVCGRKDWGIKAAAANRQENVQGYHQKNLTFVFDEASGVERPIWETVKGTLTNRDSLFLAIGNPNSNTSAFRDCFGLEKDEWRTLTWNAEESDHVDQANVRRLAREFGKDSDVYRVRVLGEFPKADPDSIIGVEDAEACVATDRNHLSRVPIGDGLPMRQCGIDLARFGNDESVIIFRRGSSVVCHEVLVKKEPIDVIRMAFRLEKSLGWDDTFFVFDAGGLGQGVAFAFREKRHLEFHSNGTPWNAAAYADRITEAWFQLRELAQERRLWIPKDSILLKQLTTRKYADKKGRLCIESKKDYLKRMGTEDATSPDRADALVMAFYRGTVASAQIATHASKVDRVLGRLR